MDSHDSDVSVKQEKINALFLDITNRFQLIDVFIAVVLISVFKVSGYNWLCFPASLFNQHVVFLLGNLIIGVCYVLSRHTEKTSKSEKYSQKIITGDASIGESVEPAPEETQVPEEIVDVKMQSVTDMEVTIKQAVKQIERFRRSQSEKLKQEMSIKPNRELQRSATAERSGLLVSSDDDRSPAMSSETVEKMSDEEFQLAVETFISKQQSFLKQEGMAISGIVTKKC